MLASELVQVVSGEPAFHSPGYYIYNMEDYARQAEMGAKYPLVAVAYEGIVEIADPLGGRPHNSAVNATAIAVLTLLFSVVLGVEYHAAGRDDSKPVATDLLDAIRRKLLGFTGVNARPWVLHGEQPLGGSTELEGVIWYGQQWKTDVPFLGQPKT
jgi:hypothetical protein